MSVTPTLNVLPRPEVMLTEPVLLGLELAALSGTLGVGGRSPSTPAISRTQAIPPPSLTPPPVSTASPNSTLTSVSSGWSSWCSAWTYRYPALSGTAARTSWSSPPRPPRLLQRSVAITQGSTCTSMPPINYQVGRSVTMRDSTLDTFI